MIIYIYIYRERESVFLHGFVRLLTDLYKGHTKGNTHAHSAALMFCINLLSPPPTTPPRTDTHANTSGQQMLKTLNIPSLTFKLCVKDRVYSLTETSRTG